MTGIRTVTVAGLLLMLPAAHAATVLADLSLEELANIEITSVSRRPEPLSGTPASVYVITADDIRLSGATTLPEALRLAPNLQVAQLDARQYAISARGFNNAIGNKLLVLIDGRTVYAPFFSGVLWDQQDVMLEDVERIEVISGPAPAVWGTNAVNGVINVVTRSAAQTQGGLVVAGGGNLESGAAFRYGTALGAGGHVRIYAKASQFENTKTAAGVAVPDGRERVQAGFRADWAAGSDDYMLQGNAYRGRSDDRGAFGPISLGRLEVSGANLLGLWTRRLADGSDIRVQGYYDRVKREDAVLYRPEESILDLEFQHGFTRGAHRILWGGGHRRSRDTIQPGLFFGFIPERRALSWTSLFAQDVIALGDRTDLTVGARVEHNRYTGAEVLPSVRWAWKLSDERLLWAAASRAVRAPARLDRDIVLPPTPPFIIAGGPGFVSEVAHAYDLGYRAQPSPNLSYSVTAFYQDWDRLRSGQTPPDAHVQNMIHGHTSGIEAWATWQPARRWRLAGGVTTLDKDLRLKPGSTDPVGPSNLGDDPNYQWMLRSTSNLDDRQAVDVTVRRVAALPTAQVPAYTAVDLHYGLRLSQGLDLSVRLRNLLDAAHPEFGAAPGRGEIGRSAFVQLRWSL